MRSAQNLDLLKAFAAEVKSRRAELGISQEELAHRANLNRTFIGKLETVKNQPSLTALFDIASGLSCEVTDLIDGVRRRYQKEQRSRRRKTEPPVKD